MSGGLRLESNVHSLQGDDLKWVCKLTRSQAEKGVMLTVPQLDGTDYKLSTVGQSVYHGRCIVLKSMGMPVKGGPARGRLLIEFRIKDR